MDAGAEAFSSSTTSFSTTRAGHSPVRHQSRNQRKEHHKSKDLEKKTNMGSIKPRLGKLRVDRPSAGAHHQYYMGGGTKKYKNNVCVAW